MTLEKWITYKGVDLTLRDFTFSLEEFLELDTNNDIREAALKRKLALDK